MRGRIVAARTALIRVLTVISPRSKQCPNRHFRSRCQTNEHRSNTTQCPIFTKLLQSEPEAKKKPEDVSKSGTRTRNYISKRNRYNRNKRTKQKNLLAREYVPDYRKDVAIFIRSNDYGPIIGIKCVCEKKRFVSICMILLAKHQLQSF